MNECTIAAVREDAPLFLSLLLAPRIVFPSTWDTRNCLGLFAPLPSPVLRNGRHVARLFSRDGHALEQPPPVGSHPPSTSTKATPVHRPLARPLLLTPHTDQTAKGTATAVTRFC